MRPGFMDILGLRWLCKAAMIILLGCACARHNYQVIAIKGTVTVVYDLKEQRMYIIDTLLPHAFYTKDLQRFK